MSRRKKRSRFFYNEQCTCYVDKENKNKIKIVSIDWVCWKRYNFRKIELKKITLTIITILLEDDDWMDECYGWYFFIFFIFFLKYKYLPAKGARKAVHIPHAAPVAKKSRCSLWDWVLAWTEWRVPDRPDNLSSQYWNNWAVQ